MNRFVEKGLSADIDWSEDNQYIIYRGPGLSMPTIRKIYSSTEELIEHAYDCCVQRELTPEEREQFGLPPRNN